MKRYTFPFLFLFLALSVNGQILPNPVNVTLLEQSIGNSHESLSQIEGLKVRPVIKPFECKIFPIRVESSLQVVLPLTENFTFRLVDSAGNVLFSHYQIFGENQVNLSHLKADKYFVEISSDKGKIVEKITKT